MTFAARFTKGDRVLLRASPEQRGTFARCIDGIAVVDWDGIGQAPHNLSDLRHAPVEIVGSVPAAPPSECPLCGFALSVDPRVILKEPGQRPRIVRAVSCWNCEFIQEVPK